MNVLHTCKVAASPGQRAGHRRHLRRGFAGEAITIPPYRYTPEAVPTIQGGQPHWIRAFIYPVTDQHGVVCEVMILYEDVTTQEQSYQLLDRLLAGSS